METINTTLLRPEEEERYQRKRLYDEEKEPVEWQDWKTEELKSDADKKWTADINEILQTVSFVSPSEATASCSPSEVTETEAQPAPTDLQELIEQAESDNFHMG